MQPHEQRVVDEKNDLDIKIKALCAFFDNSIFKSLPEISQERLYVQHQVMVTYSTVLGSRINDFK